jgi:hypothetical protein
MIVEARGSADQNVGEVWTPRTLKEVGLRDGGQRLRVLEISRHPEARGIHHPHRDTLVVKGADLLATAKTFECCGIAHPDTKQIRRVGDGNVLLPEQDWRVSVVSLMPRPAAPMLALATSIADEVWLTGDKGTFLAFDAAIGTVLLKMTRGNPISGIVISMLDGIQ